jgi:ribosomal protein L37E
MSKESEIVCPTCGFTMSKGQYLLCPTFDCPLGFGPNKSVKIVESEPCLECNGKGTTGFWLFKKSCPHCAWGRIIMWNDNDRKIYDIEKHRRER